MANERLWWVEASNQPPITTGERLDKPFSWSLKWMCTVCGDNYAYAKSFISGKLQPYHFVHGVCHRCPGSRYQPPGSLETVRLIGWQAPLQILLYQLKVELDFRSHPDHPSNRQETSL